jgi:hypothetical protein
VATAVAVGVSVVAALIGALPSVAGAATSTDLRYSVDGGATWTTSAVVAPGQEVLVRQWFANTGDDAIDGAVAATVRPDRFDLIPGSTAVCLNPSSTDPSSPDDAELACAASDESSVWSGDQLGVSPSAGHFGFGNGDASGPLAAGRVRYLNLHQCAYESVLPTRTDTWTMITPSEVDPAAASNVAAAPDTAASCGTSAAFTFLPARSGVTAFDLFDRRYLALQQCRWVDGGAAGNQRAVASYIPGVADASWKTRSTTTNLPGIFDGCETLPPAGWSLAAPTSGVEAFDLLEDRYVNLVTCLWQSDQEATLSVSLPDVRDATADSPETGSSDQPTGDAPTSGACPPRPGMVAGSGQAHAWKAFDVLDRQRSAGYVTYRLGAPESPTAEECSTGLGDGLQPFAQQASLSAPSLATQTSDGQLVVDWNQAPGGDPCSGSGVPLADPGVVALLTALGGGAVLACRRVRARRPHPLG